MQIDTVKMRTEMERKGLTAVALSNRAGMSETALSHLRSRGSCNYPSLCKLSYALGTEPADLAVPPDKTATVGARIRYMRTIRGLTMAELGELVGLSECAVHHYERDRRSPKFDTAVKIAKALGCSLDYLAGEETAHE